jgi:hypothetical protein
MHTYHISNSIRVEFVESPYKMGTTYIGKYIVPNSHISAAIMKTDITFSHFESHYDHQSKFMYYYPNGSLHCKKCGIKNVKIGKHSPAFSLQREAGDWKQSLIYDFLVCHNCFLTVTPRFCFNFQATPLVVKDRSVNYYRQQACDIKYTVRHFFMRWKKLAMESSRRKKALATLRPFIMHWATKPGGPIHQITCRKYVR